MRLSISAFTLMMVLASPGAARAQSAYSAEYMLSSCRPIVVESNVTEQGVSFPQSFETGFCWGAFSAIQRAMVYAGERGPRVCAPAESTLTQLITVFVRYTDLHPAELHEHYFLIALRSLRAAFPCQPGGTQRT